MLAMFGFGWWELVLLAGVGLLIFGRRLPEVGRNLGRGIVEFRKGLSGLEDEIENAGNADRSSPKQIDQTGSVATDLKQPQKDTAEKSLTDPP